MKVNSQMQSILSQMQSIESMAKSQPMTTEQKKDINTPSFADMLSRAIDTVNNNQQVASDLRQRFEMGDPTVDLAQVMINGQKASVSFNALVEVRNKLLKAYQDVMNMPV